MTKKKTPHSDLYPELSPEEQADAEYRLLRYLAIVQRIWGRYEQEGRLKELLRKIKRYRKSRE